MSAILVFDDDGNERQELVEDIQSLCGSGAKIIPFDSSDKLGTGASFEPHIASWIDQQCAAEIALIVCDKELGRYKNLPGLSATPISAVAMRKGLPFCQYSRHPGDDDKEIARFQGLRQWSSEEITLKGSGPKEWATQAAALFQGFELIKSAYAKLGDKGRTPAAALAAILEHPESESRIALYGSGDQGFLSEILSFYDPDQPNSPKELLQRMPRILGNWLFLSILRFPGILVNETAAASYLNIDHKDFAESEVREHFKDASYAGPFANLGPWWWRAELDSMIGEAECKDGREYIEKKGITVSECKDAITNERAGYYCMLTQKPVSAENSRGGVSWFPSGADLARIQKDKFEQITALVGMY